MRTKGAINIVQVQERAQQSDPQDKYGREADKIEDYIPKATRRGLGLSQDEPRSGD
jgi:hypothetical protein